MADDFDLCFKAVKNLLNDSGGLTLTKLKSMSESLAIKDKKSVIDLAFRDKMLGLLSINSTDSMKVLLKMSVAAAVADICSAATPFLLFADLFNTKPISDAEENFHFMEQTITALKDVSLFGPGRNVLLRMCNDLLRRLSKSQNTVFCGRIQLFLTRLFPLDEKSGLNLMSNFNTQKEISYSKEPDESLFQSLENYKTEPTEGPAKSLSDLKVNAQLYQKFWSLQEFLRTPSLCYTKEGWVGFTDCAQCVIDTFSSIKIMNAVDSERRWHSSGTKFTIYLTSEKLLDLQLMDNNFRRYILVQLLIIFQYLTAQVKFKSPTQALDESQSKWVKSRRDEIVKLLDGTSDPDVATGTPISPSFAVVNHVLERETHWNRWKNEGCPSFIRTPEKSSLPTRKRRTNPLIDRSGNKLFRFGNRELDKLWSLAPDNLEACRDKKRLFRPDLYEHFRDAILELDPKEKVDEQYKSINREEWTWRSLRLLSRRCSFFYTNWNPPGRPIKDYLSVILTEKLHPEDDKKISNGDSVKPDEPTSSATTSAAVKTPRVVPPASAKSVTSSRMTARAPRHGSSAEKTASSASSQKCRSRSPIRPESDRTTNSPPPASDNLSSILDTSTDQIASMSRLSDTDGEADDLEDEEEEEEGEEGEDAVEEEDEDVEERETMEIVS
nr:unnamed protein product [Spirometra erinaceieuropaei]